MENNRNKKIEEILGSLDGIKRASVPDFFYTRLKARMEKGYEPATPKFWMLRPAFAIAVLTAVLLINTAVIYQKNTDKDIAMNDAETLQSIAAEYSINDDTYVYDLNQEK